MKTNPCTIGLTNLTVSIKAGVLENATNAGTISVSGNAANSPQTVEVNVVQATQLLTSPFRCRNSTPTRS